MTDLFEPARHEALAPLAWDATRARSVIDAIVEEALQEVDAVHGWRVHPLDDDPPGAPNPMLYFGAAGVVWAIDHLARAIGTPRGSIDWSTLLEASARQAASYADDRVGAPGSLLMGATGVLLTTWRLTRAPALLDRIEPFVERTIDHPADDLLWGAPGAVLAAIWLHEQTNEERWRLLAERAARALLARMATSASAPVRLWQQQLYGLKLWMLGAGHGFASNALTVLRARAVLDGASVDALKRDVVNTLTTTAVVLDGHANWPRLLHPVEPAEHTAALAPDRRLVQFCHGAPGMIVSLAATMHGFDERFDALMIAAGELTWRAGPLTKGAGICHGTAGNGYALLALWASTGDRLWLDRARAFAMHAITQTESDRRTHGMRRWSLWTGDLGTACFLADCIRGAGSFPTLHEFFDAA
jgi:hypothetical protein